MATILAVDDSPEILALLEMLLTAMGHKTVKVLDGYNALKIFSEARPDIVILDYQLPAASGTQVYQRIRGVEYGKNVPVIFLSAALPDEFMFLVPEKNLVRFLQKPIDQQAFRKLIEELLPPLTGLPKA